IIRMFAVGLILEKSMRGHVDLLNPAQEVAAELMGIPSFETPDFSELLTEEKAMVAKLKKVFLMVAGSAVQKYGTELEKHQQTLLAAADILIKIYMAESAILRTEKNAKRFGKTALKEHIAMSQLYLYHAVYINTIKAKEAILSFSEGDEQHVLLMGLKRFAKYQNMPNIAQLRGTIAEKVIAEN